MTNAVLECYFEGVSVLLADNKSFFSFRQIEKKDAKLIYLALMNLLKGNAC